MSPKEINALYEKPAWLCVTCRTEHNLRWWNGLSVAVCPDPECSKKFSEMCAEQDRREQRYQEYARDYYGESS